jgi:hypothetical protein
MSTTHPIHRPALTLIRQDGTTATFAEDPSHGQNARSGTRG